MEVGKREDALAETIDFPISIKRIKEVTTYLDTKVVHKQWEVMFEDAKHTRRFTDIHWGVLRMVVRLYHNTNGLMSAGKMHEIIKKLYMQTSQNKKGANIGSINVGDIVTLKGAGNSRYKVLEKRRMTSSKLNAFMVESLDKGDDPIGTKSEYSENQLQKHTYANGGGVGEGKKKRLKKIPANYQRNDLVKGETPLYDYIQMYALNQGTYFVYPKDADFENYVYVIEPPYNPLSKYRRTEEYAIGGGVGKKERLNTILERRTEINNYLNKKYGRSRGKNKSEKDEIDSLAKEYRKLGDEYLELNGGYNEYAKGTTIKGGQSSAMGKYAIFHFYGEDKEFTRASKWLTMARTRADKLQRELNAKYGEGINVLSEGQYDNYKNDWNEKYAKGSTIKGEKEYVVYGSVSTDEYYQDFSEIVTANDEDEAIEKVVDWADIEYEYLWDVPRRELEFNLEAKERMANGTTIGGGSGYSIGGL